LQEECETLETLFANLDLGFVERIVESGYHKKNEAGRPPRNPLGLFKAHLFKRLKDVPSDRELMRRLANDPYLRSICDIEAGEEPYGRSVLSRFRQRIGPEKLGRIVDHTVRELVRGDMIEGKAIALDATFIKAYSKRDPSNNRRGYSDPDARVGRAEKGKDLGYKAHIAVDTKSELPIVSIVVPANENEKKHEQTLLRNSLRFVRTKRLVADSQYSSKAFREKCAKKGVEPIIPYPANQRKGEKGLLRVDRKFRPHGPTRLKRLYRKRSSIERTISRLKEHVSLRNHKLRGLRNIVIHVQYCILAMLFIALAALKMRKPWKARSITCFTGYGIDLGTA